MANSQGETPCNQLKILSLPLGMSYPVSLFNFIALKGKKSQEGFFILYTLTIPPILFCCCTIMDKFCCCTITDKICHCDKQSSARTKLMKQWKENKNTKKEGKEKKNKGRRINKLATHLWNQILCRFADVSLPRWIPRYSLVQKFAKVPKAIQ